MISTTPRPIVPLPFVVCSTVKEEPIHWLWNPYFPRGAMSSIIGDGGYGKSFMTCSIAADLSAGRPLPGQEAQAPQRVLMISAEDGLGPIIYPRLKKLDANMENIAVYDEGFTINPDMSARIMAAVEQFDAAVLFLDPMVVYLGGEVDSFKANEVRSILQQLTNIAKEKDIAIICVHHVKKGQAEGQHKSLGSVDFVNGVRSTVLVDVSKSGTYFMSHVKHNWSAKGPTLAYSFNNERFYWLGNYEPPAADKEFELSKTPRGKAKTFLINVLQDGPVPMLEILKLATDEGMSEKTLRRAMRGVCHSVRKNGHWVWELDEEHVKRHPEPMVGELEALAAQAPGVQVHDAESETERLIREARERMATA